MPAPFLPSSSFLPFRPLSLPITLIYLPAKGCYVLSLHQGKQSAPRLQVFLGWLDHLPGDRLKVRAEILLSLMATATTALKIPEAVHQIPATEAKIFLGKDHTCLLVRAAETQHMLMKCLLSEGSVPQGNGSPSSVGRGSRGELPSLVNPTAKLPSRSSGGRVPPWRFLNC